MKIPQSRPDLQKSDFDYVEQVLQTRQVAGGPFVEALESAFCERLGVKHAVAVSSGTSALHLALLALKVGIGDEVILPSYACAALLHAVHYTGATPVLCDIDPETLNPTAREIRPLITSETRAIIVTHTFGFPADLRELRSLDVPVIEDCAQALGSQFDDRAVGSIGQMSVFSFYATKIICAGEGGMVCTNSGRLAACIRDLNSPDMKTSYKVRYNYKMSDLAAGLALRQFSRLDEFLNCRKTIAARYMASFGHVARVGFQVPLADTNPVYYRFVLTTSRAASLIKETTAQGVMCDRPVFRPLHSFLRMPSHLLPHTASAWKRSVSIPLYPDLEKAEVERIVTVVSEAIS